MKCSPKVSQVSTRAPTGRIPGVLVSALLLAAVLLAACGGEVEFVHSEPYRLQEARSGQGLVPVDELEEWGLQTEPWVFVVDAEGRVAGKFEGITSVDEVERVLRELL